MSLTLYKQNLVFMEFMINKKYSIRNNNPRFLNKRRKQNM